MYMPKVGKKRFPYNEKGMMMAEKEMEKMKKMKKMGKKK